MAIVSKRNRQTGKIQHFGEGLWNKMNDAEKAKFDEVNAQSQATAQDVPPATNMKMAETPPAPKNKKCKTCG